jgi:Fe-S-cluster containining protein
MRCGACCACFLVCFYWSEADDAAENGVPEGLTEQLDPWRRFMRGTRGERPRCAALQGEIGVSVRCGIYARRPSVCRSMVPAWQAERSSALCDRARKRWGLPVRPPAFGGRPHRPKKAA